jgi:RNA polymerase sigma factor (sigma-70 family)
MRSDQPVTDLVTRARNGGRQAWDALVERYAPLIWSICRRHQLADADARDIGQNVWLRLVDQLGTLRDPAALPGWLATTTRRECGRLLRAARAPQATGYELDAETLRQAIDDLGVLPLDAARRDRQIEGILLRIRFLAPAAEPIEESGPVLSERCRTGRSRL